MFKTAYLISPSLIRLKLSSPNVEKVVKAPRIPININTLILGEYAKFSNMFQRNPIAKQPSRFTANVPQGQKPLKYLYVYPEIE